LWRDPGLCKLRVNDWSHYWQIRVNSLWRDPGLCKLRVNDWCHYWQIRVNSLWRDPGLMSQWLMSVLKNLVRAITYSLYTVFNNMQAAVFARAPAPLKKGVTFKLGCQSGAVVKIDVWN
jgi:hypothetical protein